MPTPRPRRTPAFQLDQNMPQVQREWRVQRISWPLLYALLLACMLGLFGQGPLSRTEIASADGRVQVELDRFLRRESPDTVELTLKPGGSSARVRLSSEWAERVDIEQVFPDPEHRVAAADAVTLVFATQPGEPVRVRLRLRAERIGWLHGWVALDDGPRLAFRQFVYP